VLSDAGMQVIERIRAMKTDDPAFADCKTFLQYFLRADQ
jgi:hypothetical protein